MNLIKGQRIDEKEEHDKHAGHTLSLFVRKFWVCLILTLPIVLLSELPEQVFGWQPPIFAGSNYLSLILSSIVFFYGGWVFIAGAWRELKARLPGMMTLIALAISTAYFYSIFVVLSRSGQPLFWELATLITIMLLGHWFEMKAVTGAQSALRELSKLLPDVAEVIIQNQKENEKLKIETKVIPLSKLQVDDLLLIRPGAKIPADGVVIKGHSEVNEALITGESKPVVKAVESAVIAGTINGDGSLVVKVSKIGEQTFLAGIMRLVQEAQASKSRLQLLADRAAFYLTIIALIAGLLTLFGWLIAGAELAFAVERVVAVLVIACPHALGLAVPLVASISTTLAARSGFLVRQRLALEAARNIDVVLFDKTGTLTRGEYGVEKIFPASQTQIAQSENEILQLAASVEAHSEHFVAKALVAEAKRRNLSLLEVKDFQRLAGKGVKAKISNEVEILVGGEAILQEANVVPPVEINLKLAALSGQGRTIVFVVVNRELLAAVALADLIREESQRAIAELKRMDVKVAMITGDSEEVARWVAQELQINEYFARVLPDKKAEKVKTLQSQGLKVAAVGDGINDAPMLTQADLGIAVGAGTNVAIESAGIILMRSNPSDIAKIIRLSRTSFRKMLQNLFWATGYNLVALPLAAGVLASRGVVLQPAASALLMSVSTIIVALNAMLLKRERLT